MGAVRQRARFGEYGGFDKGFISKIKIMPSIMDLENIIYTTKMIDNYRKEEKNLYK